MIAVGAAKNTVYCAIMPRFRRQLNCRYMSKLIEVTDEKVMNIIYHIRGKKVMLDRDLSELYGVETRTLNQAVKRNEKRFPSDFMFQLTEEELEDWKSQTVISNKEKMGLRKLPHVFTEQGVAMLSSVLNSDTAIEVNIQIVRIFSRIREVLLTHTDILSKLEQMENRILEQDEKTQKQEDDIQIIFDALKSLLTSSEEQRKPLGYKAGIKSRE